MIPMQELLDLATDFAFAPNAVEIACLLFLTITDECSRQPYNQVRLIAERYAWPALRVIAYHIRKRITYITQYKSICYNHNG